MVKIEKILCFFFLIFSIFSCKNGDRTKTEIAVKEEKTIKEYISEEPLGLSVTKSEVVANAVSEYPKDSFLLTRKKVLSNKLSLLMPNNFKLMGRALLEKKYPSEGRRPTEVYTNENASINIAFNHTQNKATLDQLPEIESVLEKQFQNPSVSFEKSEIRKINGRDFILIEFVSPAVDTQIYNLMFITSVEGRLLMGTFNCTENQRTNWESKAKEIVSSVIVL